MSTATSAVTPAPARGGRAGTLAGAGTLTALAFRRDRLMLPAWVLTFAAVTGFSVSASRDLYASTAELVRVGEAWNATPAFVALHGRIWDTSSLGAASLVKMTGLGTALVGLLAVLLVVRHTRADEEVGRTELAGGGVVGRLAPLAAALVVAAGTVAAVAVLSGAALVAAGLPVAGSAAFAASWATAGLVFAGVAACSAQVAATARAARGLAATALLVFYALRALGDTAPADGARWLSWLSPLGWAQQVRPFAGERWWALSLPVGATAALLAVAAALLARRDLGSGILADRPGPTRAPGLTSASALAWRLHRPALAGWVTGALALGILLGSIASTIDDLLDNVRFRGYIELLGGVTVLEDAFISAELGIAGVVVSAYGVGALMRLRSEEASGLTEAVLATGVPRTRWVAAHAAVAMAGAAVVMAAVGLGVGVAHAVAVGDPGQVGRVLAAALVRVPAVWVMTSTTVAFFGLSGRATALSWVLVVAVVVLGEFGPLMELPAWTLDLSPFSHLPALPGGPWDPAPVLWLLATAAALLAVGLAGFGRRDLELD